MYSRVLTCTVKIMLKKLFLCACVIFMLGLRVDAKTSAPTPHKVYVKITHYCVPPAGHRCRVCGTGTTTASGQTHKTLASRGYFSPRLRCCATRGSKFPIGTRFYRSNGQILVKLDSGGGGVLKDRQIDIACATHKEAVKGGSHWEWVYYTLAGRK